MVLLRVCLRVQKSIDGISTMERLGEVSKAKLPAMTCHQLGHHECAFSGDLRRCCLDIFGSFFAESFHRMSGFGLAGFFGVQSSRVPSFLAGSTS